MRIMIIDDDINKTETIKNAISNIFSSIPSSNEKLEIDTNVNPDKGVNLILEANKSDKKYDFVILDNVFPDDKFTNAHTMAFDILWEMMHEKQSIPVIIGCSSDIINEDKYEDRCLDFSVLYTPQVNALSTRFEEIFPEVLEILSLKRNGVIEPFDDMYSANNRYKIPKAFRRYLKKDNFINQ